MPDLARIRIPTSPNGRAVLLQRLFGRHDGGGIEGMRITIKWFCSCDNDEEIAQVISLGEKDAQIEIVMLALETALPGFFDTVERHRAKGKK